MTTREADEVETRHLDPEGAMTTQIEQTPVPAARPLSDFCMERVGDDVVLYDPENIQYHTLNAIAFDVWRLCDGSRSVEEMTRRLAAVGAVAAERRVGIDARQQQWYFLSSSPVDTARLHRIVRKHWHIEDQFHWAVDTACS